MWMLYKIQILLPMKLFFGTQPHPFVYILSSAIFLLRQQNWVVAIRPFDQQSIKYLAPENLQKKFADHCSVAVATNIVQNKAKKKAGGDN